jgi:transcriptional regulator with XRE-family HTH domain
MAFPELLRKLREKAGLSQSGMAKKAGLSVRSIQNWEQGHRGPSAQGIIALAQGLEVSAEALLAALRRADRKKGKSRQRGRPAQGK